MTAEREAALATAPPHLLRGPALSAAVTLAATAVVAAVDPHQPGTYPVCPFLLLTGHPCPLCGGLRAVNDLLHLRVADALGSNVLVVVGVVAAVVLWARWAALRARGRNAVFVDPQPWLSATALAVLIGFGVLRNLPFAAGLAP